MENIIYAIIYLVVAVAAFLFGKYVRPAIINSATIQAISAWVYKFVVSAQNQFGTDNGEKKLEYVTELVKALCEKVGIKLTDEQIRALIEDAYKQMKEGEKQE